ncbi:DgyrCDS1794 [Dimorphilus gyrociliatus]|uniref:DgyrCDS1794 n=1 Tax=Dimorphilus gyrociliatus TaxID=2664684 RepID=A0A7I8V8A6_9ANNE|nr:DgyrCDS1794 [Dimorphilus gyrociliatus]
MAEKKYDLLLVGQNPEKLIKQQPWYKERLRTKYMKGKTKDDTSKVLVGRNWTFLKYGLDDFRDGLPPKTESIFLKGPGLGPNLTGDGVKLPPISEAAVKGRFTKQQAVYDKVLPLPKQKQDHVAEIEDGLQSHPLALYPHLEQCLPPDVFEDIVDLLDPEMNFEGDEEDDAELSEKSERSLPRTTSKAGTDKASRAPSSVMSFRNPYKWISSKAESGVDVPIESNSQDDHIGKVTKEFCEWVSGLGGETNNIEESTITSLFASGYETKPALSVPIHVVELTNVPPELRMAANANPQPTQSSAEEEKTELKPGNRTSEKIVYGAWYLPTKMWKKKPQGEQLEDPKKAKQAQRSEMKMKSDDLDNELANLHGAQAFIEFMNKKNTRRPEFLNSISAIQEQKRKEEEARKAAEEAKRARLRRKAVTEEKPAEA